MNKKLIPTFYKDSIYSIDFAKVASLNVKYVFIDLDNTLASPYAKDANDDVLELIKKIKSNNLTPIIISNNHENRVQRFTKTLDVIYLFETKKPKTFKFEAYLEKNKINKDECIGIGDQTMTDVLFYNRLGIKVILVNPVVKQDLPITWIPRILDKYFRHKVTKNNLSKEF